LSQRPRSAADTYHVITFIRDGARRAPPTKNPPGGGRRAGFLAPGLERGARREHRDLLM